MNTKRAFAHWLVSGTKEDLDAPEKDYEESFNKINVYLILFSFI